MLVRVVNQDPTRPRKNHTFEDAAAGRDVLSGAGEQTSQALRDKGKQTGHQQQRKHNRIVP